MSFVCTWTPSSFIDFLFTFCFPFLLCCYRIRKLCLRACMLSRFHHVQLSVTPGTVAHQVLPSTGFSRQEYWSGLPCPPPGDLPNPGIEFASPAWQVDSLPLSHPGSPKIEFTSILNIFKLKFDLICVFTETLL